MRKPRWQGPGRQQPPSDSRWPALWISVALVAANVLIYAAVRHYDFIDFDDRQYVSENATVSAGLTWHGVRWAFATAHASNWHPLTWLSHMLDVQLYGMNAGGHHLTNLLLHIINTLLLFGVLHRMTAAWGRSAFVAALFAVHPFHVESVAWVAERKDVLSTLFWMLTLWSYVTYVRQPRRSRYVLVLVFFALGLLAKPMLVTLPFVLLLLDYWPLGRMTLDSIALPDASGVTRSSRQRRVVFHLLREKIPLLVLAVASSVVTFAVQRQGGSVGGLDAFPIGRRVENAVVAYVAYIWKMVWPSDLAVFYPFPSSLPAWTVIAAALILIGGSAFVLRLTRLHPYLLVGWLWYLGTMVPVIGLVQVGGQSMADRYTYVPLIGLFLIIAWGVPDLVVRWPAHRIALPATAAVVIAVFTAVAWRQVHYWKDPTALWEHTLQVTGENALARNNLGLFLANTGRAGEAVTHLSEAVRIKPNYVDAYTNLGLALARQGKHAEAAVHLSEALRLKPDSPEPHNSLGYVLGAQGRVDEAIVQYREAIRLRPDYANAHNNLGITLADQGRIDEAIPEMLAALRIKPDQAAWHYRLGVLYVKKGDTAEAVRHFEKTLMLDPNDQGAQRALADTRKAKGSGL